MRVCRTPNNEKPEAKQIRKLLRQDSTFFSLLAAAQPVCSLRKMRMERQKRDARVKNNKLNQRKDKKISLLKFFMQFFESFFFCFS